MGGSPKGRHQLNQNGVELNPSLIFFINRPGQIEKLEFKDWFSTSEVNTKRSILAKLIRKMIEDQELPGVVPVLPDLVGEEISEDNISELDISSVFDMKRNIEAELSQLSPDNSARCRSSRSALSSEDTSGEIFSAGESQDM